MHDRNDAAILFGGCIGGNYGIRAGCYREVIEYRKPLFVNAQYPVDQTDVGIAYVSNLDPLMVLDAIDNILSHCQRIFA